MKVYAIYSPMLEQSLTIAKFLRKYYPTASIYGILLPNESNVRISKKFFDKVVRLSNKIDPKLPGVIIPTGAISTQVLLEHNNNITIGHVTLTRDAIRVYNKVWMISYAAEIGIPVPITWQKVDEIGKYPVFYKERFEKGGGARGIAKSQDELPFEDQGSLIFQEFIESKGTYGVAFLANKGKLLAHHTHFERESNPKEGGSAIIIERFEDIRLLEYTKKLIESLNYSGWGLAEFKYCPVRRDYVFMEINAKFWASCEFAFVNEPLFLYLLFGIESREKPVDRMIFVNRALCRGPAFLAKHFKFFMERNSLRIYPGWFRCFLKGTIPKSLWKIISKKACYYNFNN